MFDSTLLGMRFGEALRGAALAGIVDVKTTLLPRRATLSAAIIDLSVYDVCGLNLQPLNEQRWHPTATLIDVERHPRLTDNFELCTIDFQEWLGNACLNRYVCAPTERFHDVNITAAGSATAIAVWFDLENVLGSGKSSTWQPAVYYLGNKNVRRGENVCLRAVFDSATFHFALDGEVEHPRHALIPEWQFETLGDAVRYEAYDRAIRRAVTAKKTTGKVCPVS